MLIHVHPINMNIFVFIFSICTLGQYFVFIFFLHICTGTYMHRVYTPERPLLIHIHSEFQSPLFWTRRYRQYVLAEYKLSQCTLLPAGTGAPVGSTKSTCHSNLMKERVSKLTYPTLQHCLRMLYTINGNSKH